MDALQLLTRSLILYLFASLASLFLLGLDRLAIKLSGITSLVGGVIGIISGITQLHAGVTLVARFATPFDFADLTLRMDSLSAFMVLVISLLVVVCSLYSLTYMREYEGKGAAAMGFFMNIFIASMVALLVMDNAFWFIVLFEMMSLSSRFLVIARQDKTSINAGMLYFFIAHAGSVLIMIAFLLMGRESGSLDFASFRTLSLSPGLASAVFLLAFFGFGAKAGMMPLHSWLPRAHPAAPSHASALMSGVMVKIGIFGILKVAMDSAGANGFASVVGHSGDGDRRNLRAPGRAICAGGTGYQTAAGTGVPSKTSALFCWQSVWRWSVCHCTTRCSPWLDCSAHCFICSTMRCSKGCYFSARVRLFRVCIPTTWKKWGHWQNGCRGQPQHA